MRVPAVCSQDISTIFGGNLLIYESAEGCQDLSALGLERVVLRERSKGKNSRISLANEIPVLSLIL